MFPPSSFLFSVFVQDTLEMTTVDIRTRVLLRYGLIGESFHLRETIPSQSTLTSGPFLRYDASLWDDKVSPGVMDRCSSIPMLFVDG